MGRETRDFETTLSRVVDMLCAVCYECAAKLVRTVEHLCLQHLHVRNTANELPHTHLVVTHRLSDSDSVHGTHHRNNGRNRSAPIFQESQDYAKIQRELTPTRGCHNAPTPPPVRTTRSQPRAAGLRIRCGDPDPDMRCCALSHH